MRRSCVLLLVLITCVATRELGAKTGSVNPTPTINVNVSGKVTAKPDVAIVFLTVRSTSSLAANALELNNKKVENVKGRLAEMGYKTDQVKFSGNRFLPASGAGYSGGTQRPSGFDVYNNLCIYIDGPALNDAGQFNRQVSLLLDGLMREGATANIMPGSPYTATGNSVVVFSVKDPAPYEKQATLQAMDKVRPVAEEIAEGMKVQITGTAGASASPSMNRTMMGVPYASLDEVPYEYFSSSFDAVLIQVRVDVRYTYKAR
jgi:uncharacterized protein YggE